MEAQEGYWDEEYYRRPFHGGFHGGFGRRPFYGFHGGFGVPFLGGFAGGLLASTLFTPYGYGYYPPYPYPPYYYY
ncbi:spore coat protein [Oceanobacillus chungangensis]|uniref:Spore coat protein n=2 Tax=Oceanobacillus chungangensis TaxID=1229152 RepID=A0A3D8PNS0_9BACI|nr:spore coat protein [Oceanobacillus chungangensis]RDW16878.1 spore coat protein [Oceanobacillus chungangensis]